jgi:hypothetical protein
VGFLPQSRHRGPLSALVPPKARREVFVLYSYRVRRPKPAPEPEPVEETSYRELQAQAKELEIPANQSREDLEAALAEADDE